MTGEETFPGIGGLRAAAIDRGFESVPTRTLEAWQHKGLLPMRRGAGAAGGGSTAGRYTEADLELLCALLRNRPNASLPALANIVVFAWGWAGHPVDTEQLRRAMATWAKHARRPTSVKEAQRGATATVDQLMSRPHNRATRKTSIAAIADWSLADRFVPDDEYIAALTGAIDRNGEGRRFGSGPLQVDGVSLARYRLTLRRAIDAASTDHPPRARPQISDNAWESARRQFRPRMAEAAGYNLLFPEELAHAPSAGPPADRSCQTALVLATMASPHLPRT